MKLSGNTMSNCIGILLAGCLALLVARFLGLIGYNSTYLASFIGIFIGTIIRYLFVRSVKKLRKTELEHQRTMREFLSGVTGYKIVVRGATVDYTENKDGNDELPLDSERSDNISTLPTVKLDGFVTIDEIHRIEGEELFIRRRMPFDDELNDKKNKTVVGLYLISERRLLLRSKFVAAILFLMALFFMWFFSMPATFMLPGTILFILLEIKDRLLTYRVSKGFFGTNAAEALLLLKFINDNVDDINDGSDSGKRKILNDKQEHNTVPSESSVGGQYE